jgi:NAD(P)-dependent dehydrogenase (short-subunit alcohol dehydrogenase family)
MTGRQRVVVVTGGGGGIGAAIAEELGRHGWYVVTVDPMVTVDGSGRAEDAGDTTAQRIVAAGGAAQASSMSVTHSDGLRSLFRELADDRGGLDAVVNVAGITRQSYFARGTEEDWLALLSVHLGGYMNVLEAALPLMAAAGHGRILGVTSGSGWRAADAGGYSQAKRAVAALTWQLGQHVPPGVTVNAISPIAYTRMVEAALERARQEGRAGGGGGLSLSATMPAPGDIGPLGAHVVSDHFGWCSGQVLFAAGSEVAVVDRPRLLEVVRTGGVSSIDHVLRAVVPAAFAAAEAAQASNGGANPRFGRIFDHSKAASDTTATETRIRSCAVVSNRPRLGAALAHALESRSILCHRIDDVERDFAAARNALASLAESEGHVDAVVYAPAGHAPAAGESHEWRYVLGDHRGLIRELHADAAWNRAVADYASSANRPVHAVALIDATSPSGQSRTQSAAQLARSAASATGGRLTAFVAGIETSREEDELAAGELVALLLADPGAAPLAGAELVVGTGWVGLRSHPRPIGTVTYGGPAVPAWLDETLRDIVGGARPQRDAPRTKEDA